MNPKYADAYSYRGVAYFSKGQFDKAIEDFTKAIKMNPNFDVAYYNRGNAYYAKGQPIQVCSDLNYACQFGKAEVCDMYYKFCR